MLKVVALGLASCFALSVEAAHLPEMKQLRVNGVYLAYVEDGSGPTVVFVHGANGDWRTWEPWRPTVAQRYRYVAYSLRYHWPNPWPGDGSDYSFRLHTEDLAAFIRALNVGPVHLVGSSYGARLVTRVAVEHPELVRSAVANDPGLIELIRDTPEGKAVLADRSAAIATIREIAMAGDTPRASAMFWDYVDWIEGEASAFDQMSDVRRERWLANAPTLALLLKQPASEPISCDKLKAIKVPVLGTRGEHGRPWYRLTSEAFMNCLPPETSRRAVIANQAHGVARNSEAFGAAMLNFLDEQSRTATR